MEADRAALEGALAAFRGEITQIPPMYSALKRDGKKLYELARAGKEVERAPRPVTIHALEVVEQTGPNCYTLRVRCSKGTYVRTLCHDIGAALGCGGCMSALRRTEAAGFSGGSGARWRRCWTHLTGGPAPAGGRLFLPLSGGDGGRDGPAQGEERQPVSLLRGRRRLAGVRPRRGIPVAGPVRRGDDEHYQELFRGVAVCRQRNV